MKKHVKLLAFLIVCQFAAAQPAKLYDEASVTTKPEFSSGESAFKKFFDNNFNRVEQFVEAENQTITIRYVVETDGTLTEIKPVVMGRISEWHKEAVRVLGLTSKWKPATKNGKPVRCRVQRVIQNPYKYAFDGEIAVEPAGYGPVEVVEDNENNIHMLAGIEVKPDFPGGIDKFYDFFRTNFKTPEEDGLKGRVYATFIVERDGALSDIKIIRDIGYGTGKEVLRVLKNSPKWTPGEQNGKKVRVQYSMPFIVDSDNPANNGK
jgi:hypothetical protein